MEHHQICHQLSPETGTCHDLKCETRAVADIAAAISPKARYIPEFSDIVSYLKSHVSAPDIILVMGSGDSSQLTHFITSALN